jgi:MFS transporter, DHA2 family, glioxin efflux transporter
MRSFYVNLPVGGVSAAIILLIFHTPKAAKLAYGTSLREKILQMDIIGTATILVSIVLLVLALQWGGVTKAWNSSAIVGTVVGFAIVLTIFIANEWYQGERSLLAPSVLRRRHIWVGCIYGFL